MLRKVRTKVICTIGPASQDKRVLARMLKAGMVVVRLNFSHGTVEAHREVAEEVRSLADPLKRPVAILQDLPGPKLRVGRLEGGSMTLTRGERIVLSPAPVRVGSDRIPVEFPQLVKAVARGDLIYMADGAIKLRVLRAEGREVVCRVLVGGQLVSGKGINIPHLRVRLNPFTPRDREALLQGLALDVDYIALSFVQGSEELQEARKLVMNKGGRAGLVAKIERRQALKRLREIVTAADALMVARGDLGVEVGLEKVPEAQRRIIAEALAQGKPVITATQMLESMLQNPYPTRAEVADIANAVREGSDALLLSEETAIGRYPVEAVKVLVQVAREAERDLPLIATAPAIAMGRVEEAMGWSACWMAQHLKARVILAPTRSGFTARQIARRRPTTPIVAPTPDPKVLHQLLLSWGVYPYLVPETQDIDTIFAHAEELALREGWARPGDLVVAVAGDPAEPLGSTNLLKVRVLPRTLNLKTLTGPPAPGERDDIPSKNSEPKRMEGYRGSYPNPGR